MLFRNYRFNKQLNKLIDAGIKIKVSQEKRDNLVSVEEMDKEARKNLTDIQKNIKEFENETHSLQNQHARNLSEMESISNSMYEKEEKATLGILGAFFDKGYRAQRKQMSILKKRNKEIKKEIFQNYKEIKESKKKEKKAIEELKNFEKDVVKLGKEKKYEVKFINYFKKHERKIRNNCSTEEVEEIRKCMQSMQNDEKLEDSDKTPKELFQLLKDVSKGNKRKSNVTFHSPYPEEKREVIKQGQEQRQDQETEPDQEQGQEQEQEREPEPDQEQGQGQDQKPDPDQEQGPEQGQEPEPEPEPDQEQGQGQDQEPEPNQDQESDQDKKEGQEDQVNQNQEEIDKKLEQIKQKEKEIEDAKRRKDLGFVLSGDINNVGLLEVQLDELKKQLENLKNGEMNQEDSNRTEDIKNAEKTETSEKSQEGKKQRRDFMDKIQVKPDTLFANSTINEKVLQDAIKETHKSKESGYIDLSTREFLYVLERNFEGEKTINEALKEYANDENAELKIRYGLKALEEWKARTESKEGEKITPKDGTERLIKNIMKFYNLTEEKNKKENEKNQEQGR